MYVEVVGTLQHIIIKLELFGLTGGGDLKPSSDCPHVTTSKGSPCFSEQAMQ